MHVTHWQKKPKTHGKNTVKMPWIETLKLIFYLYIKKLNGLLELVQSFHRINWSKLT
jgi:hypothetical protein